MNLTRLPVAVFIVDPEGSIQSWNTACELLTGYAQADIVNTRFQHIAHYTDGREIVPQFHGRDSIDGEAYLRCKNGHQLPVRVLIAPQSLGLEGASCCSVTLIARSANPHRRYALIQDLPVADIVEGLPCVFYLIDQSGHLMAWNHQLEQALEMSGDQLPDSDVLTFFAEDERPAIMRKIAEAVDKGSSSHEAVLIGKHGRQTPLLFNCALTQLGSIPCVVGTGLDITERKQAEQSLLVRERAIYSSVNAICITCCNGRDNPIEYVNPAFEATTGYRLDDIQGKDPRFMRVEGCDMAEHARIGAALRARQSVRAVLRNQRANGEVFWNDLRIDPVVNRDGQVTHFVGFVHDITEAKRYERRLQHLAHHDALTGLANCILLQDRLQLAIDHAVRTGVLGALAFLDLDNFKFINDNYGHELGDAVLKAIAVRLKQCVRDDDTVARVGGDEFVLVINEQPHVDHIAAMVERVRRQVSLPIHAGNKEILTGVSIGVSLFPSDGDNAPQVMRAADAAMYHAKTLGKNNFQFYSAELNREVHEHLKLESKLSRAIQNGELFLGYQPKVDLRSGRIVSAEALVRWRHPDLGTMMPTSFIGIAEETGLIVPLGEWVLAEACSTIAALRSEALAISVNLSARQLRQRDFVERLKQLLKRHQIAPACLELEVTESQLMDKPADAVKVLGELKSLGVQLSIDDFGTGYSSLSHLQKFPVDYIKIDRSFIGDVSTEASTVIARAIIALGHNLHTRVIAEGVETREQMHFLREHECDQMQGYYFSAALSRDGLHSMLRRGQQLPA